MRTARGSGAAARAVAAALAAFAAPLVRGQSPSATPSAPPTWFCSAPLALPYFLNLTQCDAGYYCPYANPLNPLTLPQICPPTVPCQLDRLGSAFCPPQGVFEPQICPPGSYCPNQSTMLPCPRGSYCIRGSAEPVRCAWAARCAAGADRTLDFTGLIISLLLDALIAAAVIITLRAWAYVQLPAWAADRLPPLPALPALPAPPAWMGLATSPRTTWRRSRRGADEGSGGSPGPASPYKFEPRGSETGGADYALLEKGAAGDEEAFGGGGGGGGGGAGEDAAAVLQSGFVRCNPGVRLDLRFEDLSFTLPPPTRRTIMHGVTGAIACKRVTGVLGPSGAGKTTFMNVLMGKLPRSSGRIFVNGREEEIYAYRHSIGYVPQDDTMIRELTVRENILFSARMRLPRGWSDEEMQRHVDAVIEVLGLTKCADTLVGDASERGVSGGQRKRCNIGIELAAAPAAIFLDEPTSGLDSSAAMEVCMGLRALANLGITVVAIIHQPRLEIFESIDDLVLLCPGGVPAFVGARGDALAYFVALGYSFSGNNNPADELMDFLSGDKAPRALALPAGGAEQLPPYVRALEPHTQLLHAAWLSRASRSPPPSPAALGSLNAPPAEAAAPPALPAARGASFARQVALVHARSLLQQARATSTFVLEMGVAVLAGTMMGAASSQLPSLYLGILKPPYTLISPAPIEVLLPSLGFYVAVAVGLAGSPAGVLTFGEEKLMYYREAAAGHDKLAYYTGKTLATLYRILVGAVHFTGVFVLLARPTSSFGTIFWIAALQFYCVYGLAAVISMLVKREQAALLSVIATLVAATMSGYGPSLTQFRSWNLGWLLDLSYARWAVEALFHAETLAYRGQYMVAEVSAPLFGYTLDRFAADIAIMCTIGTVYRVLAYFLLTRLNIDKQR